ncbi:hypothetical protein C8J56DRAFT_1053323 [Mycena floridula]|nr:hypothetical protein C8J56DRAFT_1053323 [Mycena floridula]
MVSDSEPETMTYIEASKIHEFVVLSPPADLPEKWYNLFQIAEADFKMQWNWFNEDYEKPDLQTFYASLRTRRDSLLTELGLANDFDALLTAEAFRLEGNELFRQGCFGRAEEMYIVSQKVFPLPLVFANLAAIAVKKRDFGYRVLMYTTRALQMESILAPPVRSKVLLRRVRASFDSLLSPEQNGPVLLSMIISDISAARKITPNSPDVAIESSFLKKFLKSDDNMQILDARRAGLPPIEQSLSEMLESDKDLRSGLVARYPSSFDYKTEGPPASMAWYAPDGLYPSVLAFPPGCFED